jgi:hypothetical protein
MNPGLARLPIVACIIKKMNIAMGYRWFSTSAGYHLEHAFSSLGFDVKYVGLSSVERPG